MAAAMTLPSEPQRSIFERAVCLSFTFRAMGTSRKVSSAHVEIDADKDLIHVSKDLLESPTLKEINSGDNAMRQWLAGQCLPSIDLDD